MVQLEFVCPIFVFLGVENIVVLGAEVEQSPHLEKLKSSMVLVVMPQEVHSGVTSQVYLVPLQWVQIGLGWVALWEVGLVLLGLIQVNQIHCPIEKLVVVQ